MLYVVLSEDYRVAEILPEFDPDFPDVPITDRYAPDFLAATLQIEDGAPPPLNWYYNPETGQFQEESSLEIQTPEMEVLPALKEVFLLAARALVTEDKMRNEEISRFSFVYREWVSNERYLEGEIVTNPHDGRQYILQQNTVAAEHQPPHGAGLLAIYRPVPMMREDGSFDFILGQNVFADDLCWQDGACWRAKKDMLPCIWPPAVGNEWQAV